MDFVPIAELSLVSGRLHVKPQLPPSEDFEYIYRSATGVRWHKGDRSLVPYELGDLTHGAWFREIVAAAASEYGVRLQITPATTWRDVPDDVRAEIESHRSTSSV